MRRESWDGIIFISRRNPSKTDTARRLIFSVSPAATT